jgi:deoxyribonuclease-4
MEIQLVRGIGQSIDRADEVKDLADKLDIELYVHAPYYMDLAGDDEEVKRSLENIKWAGQIAHEIGAVCVNTHLGLYGRKSKKATLERVVKNVRTLRDWFKKNKIKVKIGLETSGKQKVFGTLEEVLEVCRRVSDTLPVINFAHIHARGGGALKKKEDFQEILDTVKKITKSSKFITNFSGVEHEEGNKKRITPIKKGDMRFEPLGECILDNDDYDISIISSSPLLEHDAMYMKVIFERLTQKRLQKEARAAMKEEEKKLKESIKKKEAKKKKDLKKKKESKKKDTKKKDTKQKKDAGKKKGGRGKDTKTKKETGKRKDAKKKDTKRKKDAKSKKTSVSKKSSKPKSSSKGKKSDTSKKGKKQTKSTKGKKKK